MALFNAVLFAARGQMENLLVHEDGEHGFDSVLFRESVLAQWSGQHRPCRTILAKLDHKHPRLHACDCR